ncbi:translation initiation factor IF-2-like [Camelus ferus]|uniref:Translation initiation factor IF-2-like n=1 Tax=Camelus ferus TaxID=419612 RepID=A0A8B8TX54_CAMFR|nr:translation initiation factor IF-2-like [Camelus ferus]
MAAAHPAPATQQSPGSQRPRHTWGEAGGPFLQGTPPSSPNIPPRPVNPQQLPPWHRRHAGPALLRPSLPHCPERPRAQPSAGRPAAPLGPVSGRAFLLRHCELLSLPCRAGLAGPPGGGRPQWAVTEGGLSQGMAFGWGPHPCCSRTSPVGASWTPGPQTPLFVELERLPWKPGPPRPRLSQAPTVSASVGRSPAAPPAGAQTGLSGLNSRVPTRTHMHTPCTRPPRTHTHARALTHICQHAILWLLRSPVTELETVNVKNRPLCCPRTGRWNGPRRNWSWGQSNASVVQHPSGRELKLRAQEAQMLGVYFGPLEPGAPQGLEEQ